MPNQPLSFHLSLLRRFSLFARWSVLLLLTVAPLQAHHLPPGMEDVDEFEDGMAFLAGVRHPLLGLEHGLFALTVGVLVATGGRFRSQALALTFLASLLVGGWAGAQGLVLSGVSLGSALAFASPLLLFAKRYRLHPGYPLAVIACVSLLQGNAHALAWPLETGFTAYLAGLLLTSSVLAFTGWFVALCTQSLRRPVAALSH
ncbi:HupE/UreJ family protein [Prosthecobacter dejongeii]|uniref:Urease accessory protein n=1 Tax=Prosthecobacter dejongeii TaxID=48465 RepID=A0A7W7YMS9_9BACT|nr:HupE/UreJ family protein [Prosthecobacter dejongeii]MBB5038954.1 urease accessory protein [Prosthecobacter dejongeii]